MPPLPFLVSHTVLSIVLKAGPPLSTHIPAWFPTPRDERTCLAAAACARRGAPVSLHSLAVRPALWHLGEVWLGGPGRGARDPDLVFTRPAGRITPSIGRYTCIHVSEGYLTHLQQACRNGQRCQTYATPHDKPAPSQKSGCLPK
jgi:hypothetical protein